MPGSIAHKAPAGRATPRPSGGGTEAAANGRAERKLAPALPPALPSAHEPSSRPVTSESVEEVKVDSSSVPRPPAPGSGRLPRYYAQLELTDEQRQQVLSIQEHFSAQQTELERQLNALATERDEQLRRVLSRSQQRKLRQLEGDRRS